METDNPTDITKLTVAFRNLVDGPINVYRGELRTQDTQNRVNLDKIVMTFRAIKYAIRN